MKFYLAIIYIRRLKKGGFLGEPEKEKPLGTMGDFTKIFGTEVRKE